MNNKEVIQNILKQLNRRIKDFPEGIENRSADIPYYLVSINLDYNEMSFIKSLLEKEQLA